MEYSDFALLMNDKLKERGLTLKRLSELSGIALRHLENLSEGNIFELPAAPYLRGYLQKLSRILDFDPEEWWQYFQKMELLKRSGSADKLPENRFAPRLIAKYIWLAVILIVVVGYFAFRYRAIFGRPMIIISSPSADLTSVRENIITISGRAEGQSQVFVNQEAVRVGEDGGWEKSMLLEPGLNTVEIRATKFLGRETKIIRQIVYEPTNQPNSTSTSGF
jgi:transcriptional regulator with XRE-family HTH domain